MSYRGTEANDKPSIAATKNRTQKSELLFFFDKVTDIYPVISILKIVIKKNKTTKQIIMAKTAIFFDFLF